jgi:putative oxidoreductase
MLSLLRLVAGLLFFEHGTLKILHFPADPLHAAPPPLTTELAIAGVLEFAGGLLIMAGVLTRPIAFLLAGEMAVAYWTVHARIGLYPAFNDGEPAILFCFIFLYLAAAGGGAWSFDRMVEPARAVHRRRRAQATMPASKAH